MFSWRSPWQLLGRLVRLPGRDTFRGLERSLEAGFPGLLAVFAGLMVGWWLYVPIHELLHAAACLATGGEVTELEIAPLYGGERFARIFPFVTAGGDYAGRLSGFDTGGSDLVYLATVLGPYLLTVFPGVWLYRRVGTRVPSAASASSASSVSLWTAALYGALVPVALAPFVSLPGDAYEIGSILTTRIPPWSAHGELLRGDDVFRVGAEVLEAVQDADAQGPGSDLALGLVLGFLLGALWAFLTYALGAWVAQRFEGESGPSVSQSPASPDRSRG